MTGPILTRRSLLQSSLLVVGAGGLAGVTGCTSSQSGSSATTGSSKSLTYLNASTGQEKTLLALNSAYKASTGVDIQVTTLALNYPQGLLSRAQAKAMPDLYYPGQTGLRSEHAPFVQAGWPLDLTSEMDAGWRSSFRPELLAYTTYPANNSFGVKPGIYSIPFDGNNWQFYANPELWHKAGQDPSAPPKDFDALLTTLKALKSATPQAFGMAFAQSYATNAFVQTYGSAFMTVDEMVATAQGHAPWNSPGWKSVLDLYVRLRDANVLAPGAVSAQTPDLEKGFFSQKQLACFFGFAIDLPVGEKQAPGWKDFTVFLPPPATAGAKMRIAGGMGKSVAVNSKGKNVDEAVKYLKWFMQPEQQLQYAIALPTIPANPNVDVSKLDSRVKPFNDAMSLILPPEVDFAPPAADALNRGIQDIINGKSDPGTVLAAVDVAQATVK
jgi:ABC-type glycerol-3-phosphate transport system substrate-binding protein